MRLLHAGHDHGRLPAIAAPSEADARPDPSSARRQYLPLHRLSSNHRRDRVGGRRPVEALSGQAMYPAAFHYHAPATLEAALALLAEFGDRARPLAGGHSLLPM